MSRFSSYRVNSKKDIEYGCLPKDILHGIPCKCQNGIIVCEVRDYRSFLSSGGDSSEYDFPKLNRIALRLGTECVVNDLSLIADALWTYHEQLISTSVNLERQGLTVIYYFRNPT
uniref:Uncharacterized protein n=1 Tax=Aegilops tauschii subsp. strangulata TaxID=200361 RepID=A0A453HD13_AEGTS